ncbi:beta-propeller fold lactonase family protein [Nostoc flagelliforme FACHB-838]|uniref:Beta-propeller fold lactonase family protein n=1 Tax=Nostoc flagelliforme FACHB-838 TaxID=2692904 RepID=A0ABR8DXK1_9NOSO|nr:beta-propeller fold lactonase family protein [Nostoc flagelliforme]MBD2534151.1 beta-propeller fold lactonase family protein [Nostoc flagelliforme FACHB-838]
MFTKKSSVSRLYLIGIVIASFTITLLTFHPAKAQYIKQENDLSRIVYTESNIPTENSNSILGFYRNDDGKLTPLPDSPFLSGGKGIIDPAFLIGSTDGDKQIITNPEKTRLFAVNSGSNSIAVFDISSNGHLSPVKGSPFPSGGVYPVSLGLVDDFLYVAHKNLDSKDLSKNASGWLPKYTSFEVTPKGRLKPVSTFEVREGSGSEGIVISPNKKLLFSAEQYGQVLRVFRILKRGRLSESPNSPFVGFSSSTNTQFGPVGIEVHPRLPLLYVGYPLSNKVAVYSYNQDTGELTFLKVVSSSGLGTCWFQINKAGSRLYAAQTFSNSVSVYDLADPTNPVEIQLVKLKGNSFPQGGLTSVGPTNIALDSTESFLNVISQRVLPNAPANEGNGVNVLKVNSVDGTLSEVPSSPLVITPYSGSRPQGIVAF